MRHCMKKLLSFLIMCSIGLVLSEAAVAQSKTTYKDSSGRTTGSSRTDNSGKTTYASPSGQTTGSSRTDNSGKTTYYSPSGQTTGSSKTTKR